ncbi:alpha/beta hydrolase [soil metagenome]
MVESKFGRRAVTISVVMAFAVVGLWGFHEWDLRDQLTEEFDPKVIAEITQPLRVQIRALKTQAQVNGWFEREEAVARARLLPRRARIRPDQSKGVVWASANGFETELAIVSIHGFSASRLEVEPVLSEVASKLHANIVFTRLAAHGLSDGEDFATVRARDWAVDVEEAIEVGRRIGRRVAIVAMSTGAPLALEYVARHDVEIKREKQLTSLILLSPNYRPAAFGSFLLAGRTGGFFGKLLLGSYREFKTENRLHAERWTSRYRTEGLAAMMTAVESVRYLDFSKIPLPVLTIYSNRDDVVSVSEIEKRSREFLPPSRAIEWPEATRHELASATFTPEKRFELEALIQNWLQKF